MINANATENETDYFKHINNNIVNCFISNYIKLTKIILTKITRHKKNQKRKFLYLINFSSVFYKHVEFCFIYV